jgi:hypothetical protein
MESNFKLVKIAQDESPPPAPPDIITEKAESKILEKSVKAFISNELSVSPEPVRPSKVWTRPRASIGDVADGNDLKAKLRQMQQTLTRVKVRKDPVGRSFFFLDSFDVVTQAGFSFNKIRRTNPHQKGPKLIF